MKADLKRISKVISYFLRHYPEEIGIVLDSQGWTDLADFLAKVSHKLSQNVDVTTVQRIMQDATKQRFELDELNNRIRAAYGHSVPLADIEYEEVTTPLSLYHGTTLNNMTRVRAEGLKPMSRVYVHLAADAQLALQTARRHSNQVVLLKLRTEEFLADGGKLYKAGDSIYLAKEIPAQYLEEV
jgi:putative RNA 2'-phosphotransferase